MKTILIAGGGPVGVTLAMDLAWRGVKSIVFESRDDLPPNPRCNTVNARTMEVFRRLGCADAVRAAGLPADHNTDVVYMTRMMGHLLERYERPTPAQFRAGTPKGIGAHWPTPEPKHFISQLYMEPVIRAHALSAYDVDLREGWTLDSFEQDDSGVTASVRDERTGETKSVQGDYLVGADGSHSVVRRDIGARLVGNPRLSDTCSVFMRAPRLTELQRAQPAWMYRFFGKVTAVAIDGKDEWLFHVGVPPGEDPQRYDPMPRIHEAVGERFPAEITNIARWTPRAMVANRFRDRRVLLAGDAAHLWVPMGGFGMNSGVGDAVHLSWMLAGVVQGWLEPKILDAYEQERAPIGERVATQAARWARDIWAVMQPAPKVQGELENSPRARAEYGRSIRRDTLAEFDSCGMQLGLCYLSSPVIAYTHGEQPVFDMQGYRETSCPGARAPHLWLSSGKALMDAFGNGFTLLRIGKKATRGTAIIQTAQERAIPLKVLTLDEPEAVVKYEGYGLVLVRPDQHIVWRSLVEPDEAARLWDRVTGRLLQPRRVAALDAARQVKLDPHSHSPASIVAAPGQRAIGLSQDGQFILLASVDKVLQCRIKTNGEVGKPRNYIDLGGRGSCTSIDVDAEGRVWLCLPSVQAVERYDVAGHLEARVQVQGVPTAARVSSDGMTLCITGFDAPSDAGHSAWLAIAKLDTLSESTPAAPGTQ